VPVDSIRPTVADTDSIGYCDGTGGSRTTLATGGAVMQAAEHLIDELRCRAAQQWGVDVDEVEWRDGRTITSASSDVEDANSTPNAAVTRELSLSEIATAAGDTGGPLHSVASLHAHNAAPAFALNMCDASVDKETGKVDIVRYTCIQDAGKAVHPAYVEGQMQGGAVQGIGWALNEEYLFDEHGVLDNASFLDYRIPVASDLCAIETEIVEVPNPNHVYGVRGVGEIPICPPMPAVTTAVNQAAGTTIYNLPLAPPKLLAAIHAADALEQT